MASWIHSKVGSSVPHLNQINIDGIIDKHEGAKFSTTIRSQQMKKLHLSTLQTWIVQNREIFLGRITWKTNGLMLTKYNQIKMLDDLHLNI
mmetsp:Transcript_2914/g.6819  ORF Transcript_2914/g.6819 Transcript_2914/m.6819 type:complete len:91 (+) Transcript_2914:1230-1502(+)